MFSMLAGTASATDVSTLSELLAAINACDDITLTADIDASDEAGVAAFKNYVENGYAIYTGTFDGGGHTIKGLTYSNDNLFNISAPALIPETKGATIKNVILSDVDIVNVYDAAGIVNIDDGGTTIEQCQILSGSLKSTSSNAGGIVAVMPVTSSGTSYIRSCANYASVTIVSRTRSAGGIVGATVSHNVTIGYCRNYGTVTGATHVGGIIGSADCSVTELTDVTTSVIYISNSFSAGKVNCTQSGDTDEYGGIIGAFSDSSNQSVRNCLVTANVYHNDSITANWVRSIYNGNGVVKNCCYVLPDGAGESQEDDSLNTAVTDAQLESGEVAYLLNGKVSDNTAVWYQNIDNDATKDYTPFPCYGSADKALHAKVYLQQKCDDTFIKYTNSSEGLIVHSYADESDLCSVCGWDKTGTKSISTVGELNQFTANVNKGRCEDAILTADIELTNGSTWYFTTPIGTSTHPFTGTFDGNNHTIDFRNNLSNMPIGNLFGCVRSATIKNLKTTGRVFWASQYMGLVQYVVDIALTKTTIDGCSSDVYFVSNYSGETYNGAFVGYNISKDLTISNCRFNGTTLHYNEGSTAAAGFVGRNTGKVTFNSCVMEGALYYQYADKMADDTSSANFVINTGSGTAEYNNCYYVHNESTKAVHFPVLQGEETTTDGLKTAIKAKALGWGIILGEDKEVEYGYNDNKVSFKRDIANDWSTVCVPFSIENTDDDDFTIYCITDLEESSETEKKLILVPVDSQPIYSVATAGLPLIIKRKNSSVTSVTLNAKDDSYAYEAQTLAITSDKLWHAVGTFSNTSIQGTDKYFIAKNQFWCAEDEVTVPAYRCYLTYTGSAAQANSIVIDLDEIPTEVYQTENGELGNASGKARKVARNNKFYIIKDGKQYTVTGQVEN